MKNHLIKYVESEPFLNTSTSLDLGIFFILAEGDLLSN